jgi:HK97 family phage prohead protease
MQIVTPTLFKRLNRNRNRTGSAVALRKQSVAPIEQMGGDDRCLRFTISTGIVDRERDSIAVAGWDLSNFLRNPVVLWGHDAEALPIGRALDVGIDGNALKATVRFIPADTPERGQFAEAVYRLARQGFLGATSVGFRPLKWEYTQDAERGADDWFPGIDFQQQELIELSVVTVPANPEALMEEPLPAPAAPAEVASDTPPMTGEEVTAFNEEQARVRARRLRVLQLAQVSLDMHRYASAAR